jgi:hypothetical protein
MEIIKQHGKKVGGMTQGVGHLPSNLEALSSNPSTVKKTPTTTND